MQSNMYILDMRDNLHCNDNSLDSQGAMTTLCLIMTPHQYKIFPTHFFSSSLELFQSPIYSAGVQFE